MNAHYMAAEGVPIQLVIPKEGAVLGIDTVAIMKGSKKAELAYKFINVALDPQVQAEVAKFKTEIANQLKKLHTLVARTQQLEAQSRKHEQSMQAVLAGLQQSLAQSQNAQAMLTSVRTDIVEMQKCLATIQYYQIKGANIFPNPYHKEMLDALNKLVAIAIPNPLERSKFITELQGPQGQKK